MAKKKKSENALTYLQMPLPQGGKYSTMTKVSWCGLNKRQTVETGTLSAEENISTAEAPYLTPSPVPKRMTEFEIPDGYGNYYPLGVFGFDDILLVLYRDGGKDNYNVYVDYIKKKNDGTDDVWVFSGLISRNDDGKNYDLPRCAVQFNTYDVVIDVLSGDYVRRLLFFPDKASMFMQIEMLNMKEAVRLNTSEGRSLENLNLDVLSTSVMYCYDTEWEENPGDSKNYQYYVVSVDDNGKRYLAMKGITGLFYADSLDTKILQFTPEGDPYPPTPTEVHTFKKNTADKSLLYYETNTEKFWLYNETESKWNYGWYMFNPEAYETYIWVGEENAMETYGWKVLANPQFPNIKYATVYASRLFGVDDDRIYASGFNNYSNWTLDLEESNPSNAWVSTAQSNTKADGLFTGITTFQNHVVCFKRDYMHEVYNTKNPFRVQDIYAEGTIDNRTIQDVDGNLIFVSEDDVKIYTGSNPKIIGHPLNISRYAKAVSGTDNRNYYLFCEDGYGIKRMFTYDTLYGEWSEQVIEKEVVAFTHNKNGMYMLCAENGKGVLYQLDTGDYVGQKWSFETDLIVANTVDIKHIKKVQMMVDIAENATMKIYLLYDDETFCEENPSKHHLVYESDGSGQKVIRVKPRKTAHYGVKMHVEGEDFVRIYRLQMAIEAGGDLYV